MATPSSVSAAQIDFEGLLARDYRPANLSLVIPRDLYKRSQKRGKANAGKPFASVASVGDAENSDEEGRDADSQAQKNGGAADSAPGSVVAAAKTDAGKPAFDKPSEEETLRLVLELVSKTPIHQMHVAKSSKRKDGSSDKNSDQDEDDEAQRDKDRATDEFLQAYASNTPNATFGTHASYRETAIPSKFHQVELSDWERKIEWDGYKLPNESRNGAATVDGTTYHTAGPNAVVSTDVDATLSAPVSETPAPSDPIVTSAVTTSGAGAVETIASSATTTHTAVHAPAIGDPNSPMSILNSRIAPEDLLAKKRNPFLDDISGTLRAMVSWSGSKNDVAKRMNNQPLLLELGVAGRSVSKQLLPSHRPVPAVKSEEYQKRMQANWKPSTTTAAELTKRSLHTDKEKMERFVAQQQEKRRKMAKEKTNRVKEAMGTLNVLGSGRGRTITSSLMGPGGTERTGRPSRHVGNAIHDMEYIEQLDMVTSHVLFRDLSKVSLRQFRRPKIPLAIVRTSLVWQFQIRYTASASKTKMNAPGQGGENTSSYQAMMMGTHPGAVSKAKLRTEADLSPTEGNIILLEYSEERPPIQMSKGMASKIVTYYRGDKARCPVSAGGGDRPLRRKRPATDAKLAKGDSDNRNKLEVLPKLVGPDHALASTTAKEWVGRIPKKSREERNENAGINVLPEGVTEILHPKVHGPFIGEIENGNSITGLISNLFVAPLFLHEPEQTDFLMILGRNSGVSVPGRHESLGVVLRELPTSVYTVGQTEPRARVYAPNTQGEKNFVGPFVSYQIAKALSRAETREGSGLRFDEIQHNVLPNLGLQSNSIRQRLKLVAVYDKNTQIWTSKPAGFEDYPGVDALGKQIPPEGVATFEVSSAAVRRLNDLGLHQLFAGSHAVTSVGVAMFYLAGQVNAAKEAARKFKKLFEARRSNKSIGNLQLRFYEQAANELDARFKVIRQKHEVAKFIYEELQLAPWHITGEFIDVHKKGEGTGMMKLTGLGDPSGVGDAFSFLREVDSKPSKSLGAGAMSQSAQMKKITGTDDDLRKLTMAQMAKILRSYGMAQKQIDTLKRWDRVHVIRDFSTKNASDGMSDGLERFARGEKMKLSEQKEMYRERIKAIWKRQIAALSSSETPESRAAGGDAVGGSNDVEENSPKAAQKRKDSNVKDDSDSESEDDDFIADFEEEMMDRPDANQLVMEQVRDKAGGNVDASLGQLRSAAQDRDLTKDARELAALKRLREEERATKEGMPLPQATGASGLKSSYANRKVVRRRVTKTFPDGRQVTTFQFVVKPEEVGKIMARLQQEKDKEPDRKKERPEYPSDDKLVGHAMFEDEDDFEYNTRGRRDGQKRRGVTRRGRSGTTKSRKNEFQFGKLKNKVTKEQRMKKRKREEEEAELYTVVSKRKGTSNRKERGSIRERRPHVIMADRLESIRSMVESRPTSNPFVKPVNKRLIPRYYEVISNPIDLSTIRDKIQKYEYRTVDSFLKDFELMKANAIQFNGVGSILAEEAMVIYQLVKERIEENQDEFGQLEVAVDEQMNGKPKKRKKKAGTAGASKSKAGGATGKIKLSLGSIPDNFDMFENMSDDSGD